MGPLEVIIDFEHIWPLLLILAIFVLLDNKIACNFKITGQILMQF